jgi:DNA-binding IclR family transcriptional regulator
MIQVIERFHKIMDIVAEEPERVRGLSELAVALEVSAPACSNIVRTMTELGYLRSLGPRRGFVMGDTPYYLTRRGQFRRHLVELAMPALKALEEELNEFVVLVTENHGNRFELIRLEGHAQVQVRPNPGLRNLLQSSTGCAMLSYKTPAEIATYWERHGGGGNCLRVNTLEELNRECGKIRKVGYCLLQPTGKKPEELGNYPVTAGFPVRENQQVVAAVGIMLPALRMLNGNREKIVAAGLRTAQKIEGRLV